ncbi:hypothetical protein Pmar_PMAR015661 [Perkinsus marinus ATCC 50983]|uniref:Uncharacterized protein n=1 Tax=Perkinsus marinus (strain ATCC 50983 / TXsc) TaxID=423536 RepID=C5K4A4_PERM5|nr:hypothetical protein Pmar_PMAR015661 [Perkinsus marinus ATCC 50983]EER20720.1 hypothetical protein Pmar_PMAR015661 [Perkinsus marinus ATCC 50983]|eukprot:XP_002788924.1 hypothetical protein Pmar_PMAR015661 [Perkinsus marinus ATCC 50983]
MANSSTNKKDAQAPGAWAYFFCLNTMLLEAVLFVYMAVTILSRSTAEEMDLNGSLGLSWLIIAFVIARGALSPSDIVKRESTLVMTIFHALNSVFIVYQYFFNEAVETSLNAFLVDLSVSIGLFLASLYCNHIYRRTLQLANAESPVTESVAASGKDAKKGTAKKAKAVKTA